MNRWQQAAKEFADRITALGFQVYLSKSGEYGFLTDDTQRRVLSWSLFPGKLHGNYGPPSQEAGTGWVQEGEP